MTPANSGLRAKVAGLIGWINATRGRKLAAIGLGVALLVSTSVAVMFTARRSLERQAKAQRPTLQQALAALDRGSVAEARMLAEQLDRTKFSEANQGATDYIAGVAAAHEADELWGPERKSYYLLAAKHLEVAREKHYERASNSAGLFLLGKCQYLAGQIAECRPVLEEGLEADEQQSPEFHSLLASAYRRAPNPDFERALAHNRELLADPDLSPSDRESALLRDAQLLWQLKEYAACATALDRIPAEAYLRVAADLLRGRLELNAARQLKAQLAADAPESAKQAVEDKYHDSIQVLRRAQDDPLDTRSIRRSMYLIGVCLHEMGDPQAALAQFERTRSVYLDTAEGIAAGLDEADLLSEMNRPEDALAAYRRVLGAIPAGKKFSNRWIPEKEFRQRVLAAYQQYFGSEQFERAIALAERLSPLFARGPAVRLAAEAQRAWGQALLHSAEGMPEPQASETRRHGREVYRQAGHTFAELAELEFTSREYPDDMWQCAECFLAGQQFGAAVQSLEEYLKYELRRRRPVALVHLGEALLALGRIEPALEALTECIEYYPNDAASYQARLGAARANAERGDMATAEALLRENLNGERLTPESKQWRESLFTLGKLLVTEGRYPEAIERLEEAVARYPDALQSIEARYLIAEACRQAAKEPQEKAASDAVETARIAHLKQAQQFLETALHYYDETQQVLNRRHEQTELTPFERATLRNAYFATGAALFELGRYEDALRAYSAATNRYQHDPEVLEAFAQIATCYRRLNRPREARGAVQQAKVVLERIKSDASFDQATIYSRREWQELLDWMAKL